MERFICNQLSNQVANLFSSKDGIILRGQHMFYCLQVGYSIVIISMLALARGCPYWWIHVLPFILTIWTIPFIIPLYKHWGGWPKIEIDWSLLDGSHFLPDFSVPPLHYLVAINLKNPHTLCLLFLEYPHPSSTSFFCRIPCLWFSNLVLSRPWPWS